MFSSAIRCIGGNVSRLTAGVLLAKLSRRMLSTRAVLALLPIFLIHPGHALDLGPMDGIPPPPGITAISLEYQDRTSSGLIYNDTIGPIAGEIDRQALKLRLGHGFSIGSMPAYAYGELAFNDPTLNQAILQRTGQTLAEAGTTLAGDDGVGDLALATAIWPYANRDAGRFWGIAGYVVAPTGDYQAERNLEGVNLNAGGNRWIGVLQTGVHQRLGERWHWSIGSDITVFEDNDEVRRITGGLGQQEVEPYITYQSSLAWQAHPAVIFAASYYIDRGAEARLDDGDWQSAVNRERYGLWAIAALSRNTRLSFSYKSTVDDASDFELKDNFQLRIIRFF